MAVQEVRIGGRLFSLRAPRWWPWIQALDKAAGDSARLLEESLLTCVEGDVVQALRSLKVQEGDRLLEAVLRAAEEERTALGLELLEGPEEWRVKGHGVDLRLHPWTFGERNEALRRSLSLVGGQVTVNLPVYEMQMLQDCVTTGEGERLPPAAVVEWPLPLGDMVIQALDRLNGVEEREREILQVCVREGREHPDLALLYLCRSFGWRPEQVERMDARLAERLLAALKAVEQERNEAGTALHREGVTRIVVEDD